MFIPQGKGENSLHFLHDHMIRVKIMTQELARIRHCKVIYDGKKYL